MTNKESLFDNILDNSVNAGLKNNFKNAFVNAGVNVPSGSGLWEYPDIIRKNLVAKTITGINIVGKDIISVNTSSDGEVLTYNISSTVDSNDITRPNYANPNNQWGKNLTIKDVFDDLFTNILPAVRGVHSGDITITNISGNDTKEWYNSLFNKSGLKTGLEPTSRYIRLYLTCQAEPIFINIGNLIEEITNGYNVKNSDTVQFEIDDENNALTAHINVINENQLQELGILTNNIDSLIENYTYNI